MSNAGQWDLRTYFEKLLFAIFIVSTSIGNVKKHRSEMWKNINDFCEINDQTN